MTTTLRLASPCCRWPPTSPSWAHGTQAEGPGWSPAPSTSAALAFGLGGLIAFGPIGGLDRQRGLPSTVHLRLAGDGLARGPDRNDLVLASPNPPGRLPRRADALDEAVERAMQAIAGPTTRTVHGYEDAANRRGVTLETGRWLGYAVVVAYGENPESLIEAIRPVLASQLETQGRTRSRFVVVWFALAGGTLAVLCATAVMLARAETQAAIHKGG